MLIVEADDSSLIINDNSGINNSISMEHKNGRMIDVGNDNIVSVLFQFEDSEQYSDLMDGLLEQLVKFHGAEMVGDYLELLAESA